MYFNKWHKIEICCSNIPNFIFLLLGNFQYLYSVIKIFHFNMHHCLMNIYLVIDILMSTLNLAVNPTISFRPFFLAKDWRNYQICCDEKLFRRLTGTQYLLFKNVTTSPTPLVNIYLRGKISFFLACLIQGQWHNFGKTSLNFFFISKYKIT